MLKLVVDVPLIISPFIFLSEVDRQISDGDVNVKLVVV